MNLQPTTHHDQNTSRNNNIPTTPQKSNSKIDDVIIRKVYDACTINLFIAQEKKLPQITKRWLPQKRRWYYYINGEKITNLFKINGSKRLIAPRDLIDSINDNKQFPGAYTLATDTKSQELMETKFFKEKGLGIYVKNDEYTNIRYLSDGLPSDGKDIVLSSDNTLTRWECPFLGKAITIFYDKY